MRQKALQFKMVCAIEKPRIDKVRDFISQGVDLEHEIMYTKTPLTHSIELRHEDVAILLLENGCNPKQGVKHFPFSQPIHLAARENLTNVLQKLIDLGIDTDTQDSDQMTPLIIASYSGQVEAADLLIRNGAKINAADSCQRTPLHRAIENGKPEIVKLLLQHGANLNKTDQNLWTPLHLTVAFNEIEIFNIFMDAKCHLDIEDINGQTPLTLACSILNRQHFDLLKRTQYQFEARKREFMQGRYTSLLQRQRDGRGSLHLVVALINAGADIDGSQYQPITVAAEADLADTVYMLINYGAWIPINWKFLSPDVLFGENMAQILDRIKSHVEVQITLLFQCKRKIRKLLAHTGQIESSINKLPIPTSLKTFLR